MSHSTNIRIKLALDTFDLECGSRRPAEAFGVAVGQSKTLTDGEALEALWKMPQSGAGRMSLFGVLYDAAVAEKYMYQASASKGWLEVTISLNFHFIVAGAPMDDESIKAATVDMISRVKTFEAELRAAYPGFVFSIDGDAAGLKAEFDSPEHRAQFETENADHLAEAKANVLASD